MRVLPFTKYSPCGNTTILVRESSLSPADRARVAAEIIALHDERVAGLIRAEREGYKASVSKAAAELEARHQA